VSVRVRAAIVGKWRRSGTRLTLSIGVAALLGAFGCGSSESVSDQEIIDAVSLVRSEQDPGYNIEADPFCQVDLDLLNDEDEVSKAQEGAGKGLVITNSDGNVGVQAVPPFAPDCVKKARRGLNTIQ
jgi:hypothetical protein